MSDPTQPSNGAIGTPNPKFNVVVGSTVDRILKLWPDNEFVIGENCSIKALKCNRALAGIETIQASIFVR
jgi:hypothetical protein